MEKKDRNSLYAYLFFTVAVLVVFLIFKPESYVSDPMNEALSAYRDGKYKLAMTHFSRAERLNNPIASFALGAMYFSGKGTDIDIPKALAYYQKAADWNYAPAQTTLALLYMEGQHVRKDPEKAVMLARKAAEQNEVEAQTILAGWFENGNNIEQNIPEAVRYYEMAARNGDANAKTALSVIYKDGKGAVLKNPHTAKRWADSIQKQKRLENIFQNLPPDYISKPVP